MFDVAIIGNGPAAVSAALNLRLLNKDFIWFGTKDLSRKVEISEKIANYPGVSMVSGSSLNQMMKDQIDEMGIEIIEKMVTLISKTRRGYMVLAGEDIYDARTVLLCIGATAVKGYPKEDELLGHGVSYCATCDGHLYQGKTIAVYVASEQFEHEAAYLADLACRVYLYAPYDITDLHKDNVVVLKEAIVAIEGEERVSGIRLKNNEMIDVDGIFIFREALSATKLLKGLETEGAHIIVDRHMASNKEGCFAAGDCTGRPYQIAKAVGEGNVAAHSIVEYLSMIQNS